VKTRFQNVPFEWVNLHGYTGVLLLLGSGMVLILRDTLNLFTSLH
jgi:hypothetical protein